MHNILSFNISVVFFLRSFTALLSIIMVGCDGTNDKSDVILQMNVARQAFENQLVPKQVPDKDKPLIIVESLDGDVPVEDLKAKLPELFTAIGRMPRSELPNVYQSLALLRNQPNIVQALTNHYLSLESKAINDRLLNLQVLGELQRPDAQNFFMEVIWKPLPEKDMNPGIGERISIREYEEMIQAAAVRGVSYLKTPQGTPLPEANAETLRIIKEHPSRAVKLAAIDAYMWNNNDSVAKELYTILPEELHPYVERPRFYQGANQAAFNSQLKAWRDKWAQ